MSRNCYRRYVRHSSEKFELQTFLTASNIASRPLTFNIVSNWPANDATLPSSSVELNQSKKLKIHTKNSSLLIT